MIYEVLLPLPINKTFYYEGVKFNKEQKNLFKGSLVEVEFKIGLISKIPSPAEKPPIIPSVEMF